MVKILGEVILKLPVTIIEWVPRNWSSREAWGPDIPDGFYATQDGEIYRLSGNLVIYVSQQEYLQ